MRLRVAFLGVMSLSLLVAFGPLAQAGTVRDDRDPNLYLSLGAQAQYASVGRLTFTIGTSSYLGSGTLIAKDWVLTAGHCVDQAKTMNFYIGGTNYTAKQWIANPNWNGDLLRGYDVGLVQLSKAVTNVAPAARYAGTAELGKTATIAGYGMTGTGLTGATTLDWKKRAGQNVVDVLYAGLGKDAKILLTDFDNPRNPKDSAYGSSKPLSLEFMTAPGDSGGGLFIDSKSGPLLAGVTSFGAAYDGKVDSDYGDIGGYSRVSYYNSWVDSVLRSFLPGKTNVSLADYAPVRAMDAEISLPEPATLGLLAAGLGGLAWRSRRRRP